MSVVFVFRFLRRVVGSSNRDDQVARRNLDRPTVNRRVIDEFLTLSRSSDAADISDKLRVFLQCNLTISGLTPESSTRLEINRASVLLFCGTLSEQAPVELTEGTDDKYPYVQLVTKTNQTTVDYDNIFVKLIQGTNRVDHPAGLSNLASAFGILISLCTSHMDRTDVRFNKASGFLDLSPLYGLRKGDDEDIRAEEKGRGLLRPDAFAEDGERLVFLPRAVSVLLILFNRNHNYIARRLFQENENGKWVDPATLENDEDALATQDEEIFQLSRRINCGLFRNIVVNDFLKGLLGLGSHENNPAIDLFSDIKSEELGSHRVSVEFAHLPGWCAMAFEADAPYIERVMNENFNGTPAENVDVPQLFHFLDNYEDFANMDKGGRPCAGLIRDEESFRFDDTELADILQTATETTASAFRARSSSSRSKVFELAAMKQARDWNVCSFNEFRKLLGLPAYKSFTDWCPNVEISNAAQELYGDIDKLELYVGLRGEQTLGGAGFCLGKTMTQALITDIVRVVRSDPDFTTDFTRDSLTNWGYEELIPNLNNGAFGAFLPKLLLRNLRNNYTYNSVLGLFPFTTPTTFRENLNSIGSSGIDYEFGRPVPRPIKVIDTLDEIRVVLGDPNKYPTSYGEDLQRITSGYGYFLGFDDKTSHDRDEWMTLKALIPDSGAFRRYANFYVEIVERRVREQSKRLGNGLYQVDIIQDVISAVSAYWVAERLCGIPLNTSKGYTVKELYQMLLDLNNCIFGEVEPQDRFALRHKAIDAGRVITGFIERSLERVRTDDQSEGVTSQATSLFNELFLDEGPEYDGSDDFLARLAASGRDVKELSATALGLAVLSSVSYAQTCASAVKFYLDDARSKEREILRDLAKKGPEANEKIMGYIRESQRLNPQIPVLHRDVAFDHVLQIGGSDPLELKQGDHLLVDLGKAHAEPKDIDPDRTTRFIQGSGFHKCVGVSFVEKTMPEVFKAIFRLEDISCEVGKGGFRSLIVSYKRSKDPLQIEKAKKSLPSTPLIQRACDFILVILAIVFLYWMTIMTGSVFSSLRGPTCSSPRHLRSWEVYTMLPGPDNKTAPFIYTAQQPRPRRLSFIDIDTRDMRFNIFVDGKLKRVSTDFELDKSVDCGQDVNSCVDQGFSKGSVVVPSGKHTVRVEWIGKDFIPGTNLINWDCDYSRRFMWKQESC